MLVALVLLIAGAAVGGGDGQDQAQETPAAEPPEPSEEPTEEPTEESDPTEEPEPAGDTFGDGTWVVPADVRPGTYRAAEAGGTCYWEKVKNFSGDFNAIIANGNGIGGPLVVTIENSAKGFTSQDCGEWSSDLSRVSANKTRITNGMWVVGVDVSPGTYRTSPGGSCYWERLKDFEGGLDSIIANDLPTGGSAIVEIHASDAGFTSIDCGEWERVG